MPEGSGRGRGIDMPNEIKKINGQGPVGFQLNPSDQSSILRKSSKLCTLFGLPLSSIKIKSVRSLEKFEPQHIKVLAQKTLLNLVCPHLPIAF